MRKRADLTTYYLVLNTRLVHTVYETKRTINSPKHWLGCWDGVGGRGSKVFHTRRMLLLGLVYLLYDLRIVRVPTKLYEVDVSCIRMAHSDPRP